jgi:hypothetical protein
MKRLCLLAILSVFLIGCCLAAGESDYSNLREAQKAACNVSQWLDTGLYADISNASEDLAPKISTGDYESTKYVIPVGPYKVSFELRSSLGYFGVEYYTHNETVGSGKEYRKVDYDVYSMMSGNVTNAIYINETTYSNGTSVKNSPDRIVPYSPFHLVIYLMHYKGPAKYSATYPYELLDELFSVPKNWEIDIPTDITIDGKKGFWEWAFKWNKNGDIIKSRDYYRYELDQDTFVAIRLFGDWDDAKDTSLFLETIHIE